MKLKNYNFSYPPIDLEVILSILMLIQTLPPNRPTPSPLFHLPQLPNPWSFPRARMNWYEVTRNHALEKQTHSWREEAPPPSWLLLELTCPSECFGPAQLHPSSSPLHQTPSQHSWLRTHPSSPGLIGKDSCLLPPEK